ncbi:PQQ-binding-like beta-propeller repeat protein [Edaphobacter modestus]|uniref:Quinoprotein glucose dehydrogenase n=1 Tax=Edaphobacter modestus TaxID=388466 RepID=A0A4Q7YYU8_9BACT|nr:PQQ-binding-like beta-propeller repeat protein [Edaphobacter modestus]RZU42664.1 quinoprotein glucose dehydrogenase [Edaphobacter modestus]
MRKFRFFASIPLLLALRAAPQDAAHANWPNIGASPGNSHYSTLQQINRSNVSRLKVAWTFQTNESGGLETTPIVVDGILYAYTPSQKVIALDAATGNLRWKFDAGVKATGPNRGITLWSGGRSGNDKRLLAGIANFLYALDPATGRPIPTFGHDGRIDLREGLGRDPQLQSIALTTPGVLYKDLIIVGGRTPETLPAPPGDIRAFDVHTGALRWSFHTIPHPGEPGYETWPPDAWKTAGSANNWAGMAVDAERGIVYVPTGSAVPDFYGVSRLGDNLYANTLLALDAATGKRLWHFQGVHHDLWDRDFPAAPILVSIKRGGKLVPAIAQTTKQGTLYLFDRTTGKSLFPIEERPALTSPTPGEIAAKTQPYPLQPEPFAPQAVTEDTLTQRTPEAHAWAVNRLREMRNDGQFVPLSVGKDTLVTPSFEGGAEWGGPALDPQTGILYINANNYASMGALAVHTGDSPGRATYLSQCSVCHGDHRQGSAPAFPSLLGITQRLTSAEITAAIHDGRGRMPAIPLQGKPLTELLTYLATPTDPPPTPEEQSATAPPAGSKTHDSAAQYTMTGYRRFNDPDGYPATATPWGTLNALDLVTGIYLWKIPLGQYPELAAQGLPDTGSENYGGPTVTAGGLLFIAATNFDHKIRAFDKTTGKLLWEATLPFAGNATPITYQVNGRQYLVIAAGGSSLNPRGAIGGVYVAFALPE